MQNHKIYNYLQAKKYEEFSNRPLRFFLNFNKNPSLHILYKKGSNNWKKTTFVPIFKMTSEKLVSELVYFFGLHNTYGSDKMG
jgi:phage terminase large subunit-like protein